MTARKGFDWSQPRSAPQMTPLQMAHAKALDGLMHRLEETQWLSADALRALQMQQLAVVAKHFAATHGGFRKMLGEAGIGAAELTSMAALRKLPLLTRRTLQGMSAVADDKLPQGHAPTETLTTSGSTGEPVVVRRTAINALFWYALTMRELFWHQTPFSQRFTAIRATNSEYALLPDWSVPVNLFFETGPAQAIPITTDIATVVAQLRTFRPETLLVYPGVLAGIERQCRAEGRGIEELRLIRTIGETLPEAVRQACEETFGCAVIDNYSAQEVGTIAVQCPESDLYHVMDEALIVEVLDENDAPCAVGEAGRAVITDLRNAATPLFRYDIGDYVEVGPPCPCGRGLSTLARVAGRERNLIAMPDGTRHWPLVGYAQFRSVAPVLQFQIVQTELTKIEARLVTERALTASEENALRGVITKALGYPFEVSFAYFDGALPRSKTGKFEEFLSLVQS
ncbi:MAG TPA: hypothetical protein VHL34_24350 [Rhizomicrobium sp.]|jgi:phenylacetate-CoA ligase|nr:hypothetical protein [Rhizomicrobium sp.]